MKFIDLINEDDQSEWDKLYKKTQLVFKTLRKGRIRTKSGVVFSYKIPEKETHISVASSSGNDDLTAYIMCEKIKIREESKECSDISYSMFGELIKRKFSHFDILFIFNVYPEDIEKWAPETINEDYMSPDQEKELKKCKTIFKALKKGTITIQPLNHEKIKLRYTIGDNVFYKWEYYMGKKELTIVTNKQPEERVTIYSDNEYYIDQCLNHNSSFSKVDKGYEFIDRTESKIKQKFERFNAKIHINGDMNFVLDKPDEPQPINEDNNRRIKRARTIYKGLKKGLFNRGEHGSIKYILPDVYDVHIRSIDDVVIIKVGDEESENPVIFLYSDDDGRGDRPNKVGPKYYYTFVEKLGHKYFEDFGIKLIC